MAMKTVKEVSELTGITVRALHYYDKIGLLKPAGISEAGYRLYDDNALETLQQILFFREFDLPLKEIKAVMAYPTLKKEEILAGQRLVLDQKRQRLERMIASIDSILRGEKQMDFEVFSKDDVEELFQTFVKNAPENMLQAGISEFGSMEAFQRNYVEKARKLYNQPENREILLESYGNKEKVLESAKNPMGEEGVRQLQQETDRAMKHLIQCKRGGLAPDTIEAKLGVCEYGAAMKKAFRLENERHVMLRIADTYRDYPQGAEALDRQYEEDGIAEYMVEAIRTFYGYK